MGWALAVVAFLLAAAPLLDIPGLVAARGASALSPAIFTSVTNGISGGLLNAIVGTFVLSGGALIPSVPVGVGAGIYLSEFGGGPFGALVPLIYTAGWSNNVWSGRLPHEPIGYLTYVIWSFINQPFACAHALAFAAAFLVVLVINVAARLLLLGSRGTVTGG